MGGQAPYCPNFPSSHLHRQIHCNPHQHPGRWFCRNWQTDSKVYLETQNPRSQNFHINPKKSFYPPRTFHTIKRQGDEATDRGERKTRTELPSLRAEKTRPNPPNAKSYLSSREQRSLSAASAIGTHSSIQFPSHIFTHLILDSVEPGRFVPGDPSLLQLSRCSFSDILGVIYVPGTCHTPEKMNMVPGTGCVGLQIPRLKGSGWEWTWTAHCSLPPQRWIHPLCLSLHICKVGLRIVPASQSYCGNVWADT